MLRKRKNRRYNETNDDEGDGERKFDIAEQIKSGRFDSQIRDKHLVKLSGDALCLRLIQRNGFDKPILVAEPDGLDLHVPPKSFLVRDVRNAVGHQRIIDVMDVKTQKNIEMSMKDWCKYYESKNRDRLLNVISLEFSHTELDQLVESPMIVRLLDWVDLVWPKFLKESQTESTNSIDKMKYPKVQKYCLMSVKGSYTDFHLDFGGTSVWYHILRGRKIFWMVPPTELNLQIFEEWTLSGMQQDVFFGDTVEECFRVELSAGNTFFIPSGWIHAVYTLEDSLVFGGNFLHSFGIENQLKVSKIEDATKVPIKFRYPFYTEILWYAVQHYVYCLTEKDHLHRPDPEKICPPTKTNSIEIEDETTESEQDECDTRNKKNSLSTKARRGRQRNKSLTKKASKPPSDDESTEIDSSNEESTKAVASKTAQPVNTCRMTKNSLLRLQYEVEDKEASTKSNKSDHPRSESSKSPTKKKTESNAANATTTTSTSPNALNLADIVLSHESKSNGWSGMSGQSIWSKPNLDPKEPKKIHITKCELNGLKLLVKHLSKLSGAKKNLPTLIRNSRALLDDCRRLIVEHENDDPELAITGTPMIPKLLHTRQADMNELIGQFFKPTEDSKASNTEAVGLNASNPVSSLNFSSSKAKIEATKSYNSTSDVDTEKRASSVGTGESTLSKSPNKETKCLTPNKKAAHNASLSSNSSIANASSSSASPPPRPKSPPTRPLSNNQYSSRPKNDSNLLLPGSFADLIAATSTEKKASDGSDVAASLFGMKDLGGSSKSSGLYHHPNKSTAKDGTSNKSTHNLSNSQSTNSTAGNKSTSAIKTAASSDSSSSTPTNSGAGVTSVIKELPRPNSPEPPKANQPQKRFINPTSFRPQNKEKLIYASAPYISPVHAPPEPSRCSNPYSWPTAAPNPPVTSSPLPPPVYSTTSPAKHAHTSTGPFSALVSPNDVSSYGNNQRSSLNSHSTSQASATIQNRISQDQATTNQQHPSSPAPHQPRPPTTVDNVNDSKRGQYHDIQQLSNSEQQQQGENKNIRSTLEPQTNSATRSGVIEPPPNKIVALVHQELKDTATINNPITIAAPASNSTAQSTSVEDHDQKVKKQAKPRGPPKKSKEARQVLDSTPAEIKPLIPTSVIKLAIPATSSAADSNYTQQQQIPKIKPKRPKKQKEATISPPVTSVQQQQQQQALIHSLVRPVVTTAAGGQKATNPQPYFISTPFMFNTMAQYQQMPRTTQMPLLTTAALGSPLGLPLQQGARIVWATQPRPQSQTPSSSNVPNLSTATTAKVNAIPTPSATTQMASGPPVTSAHSDNAALLSLATTALSTAPMIQPSQTPQALVVSSPTQAATGLFASQQFFRPLVHQMPTHYITRPGAPRQSGQLVFARLPNHNQPRYLITQPGFLPQQRFQAPPAATNQPTPGMAFATFKPHTEAPKAMKAKKVKTN